MEVKVWVDGLQRVVCGASWDTTCQDVVIALAHAMGRTGRFTLIEKWRDNERPLTPAECPLQVLNKWGEFAAEVRFVLCQADCDGSQQKTLSRERLAARKGMEKSASMHRIVSPQSQGVAEASVKRSLTFSGAHNNPLVDDPAWLGSSMPTSKVRKTQQGPVPNGDMRQRAGPHPSPHSSSTQVRQVRGVMGGGGNTISAAPPPSSSLSPTHHPRRPSPARHQPGEGHPHGTDPASTSPLSSSVLNPHHLGDASRPSAFQPPLKNLHSRGASPSKCSPLSEGHGQPQPPPHHSRIQPQPGLLLPHSGPDPQPPQSPSKKSAALQPQAEPQPHPNQRSLQQQQQQLQQEQNKAVQPSFQAKSLPPSDHSPARTKPSPSAVPSHPQDSSGIVHNSEVHHQTLVDTSSSATTDDTAQADPLQIEEYDLDNNFPGGGGSHAHKDWNHNHEAPLESLEYRLEDGLGSGQGSGSGSGDHLEGEHAKLLRLVHMQQQRLKTQESQISLVNTEISSLEEKEMEYEENLHVIMEELLLQENRQRDLEPQLHDLEEVDWETALEEEEKHGIELTLEVASCKAALLEEEEKLEEAKSQEAELLEELQQEEEKISQDRERLKHEEERAREEESRTKEEISQLQTQFEELQDKSGECESSLAQVEGELTCVEKTLKEKSEELESLEGDLKEENLKEFGSQLVPRMDVTAQDSQKMLRKILEDSLSPRLFQAGEGADNPPGPALLAAFATSNQSGVWV